MILMQNNRIAVSWNEIEPDKSAQERMLNHILASCHNYQSTGKSVFRNLQRKSMVPIAAGMAVVLLSGSVAYGALSASGQLNFFKRNPTSDKHTDVEFEITDDIRVQVSDITGEVNECSQIIAAQMANQDPLSSQNPSIYCQKFSSIEDADRYVGYADLNIPEIDYPLENVEVTAYGEEDGSLTEILIESKYTIDSSIAVTSDAMIFTEYYQGDIGSGFTSYSDDFEGVDYFGTTKSVHGREFYVVNSTKFVADWLNQIVFWQEKNVLYQLHIRFQEEDQDEVTKIMLEWMGKF
jgi:hypothetical protein